MGTWLKTCAWLAAIGGAVLFAAQTWLVEVWTVPSDDPLLAASIAPVLAPGDVVLVTRRTSISRGYLLRCADPDAPGRFVVARAIGSFGDHVEISDDLVSIDGHYTSSPSACDPPTVTLQDPRDDEQVTLSCALEEYGDLPHGVLRAPGGRSGAPVRATVEAGKWFLVSDDRHVHLDSRDYGQIDASTCQHVIFRVVGAAGFNDKKSRLDVVW